MNATEVLAMVGLVAATASVAGLATSSPNAAPSPLPTPSSSASPRPAPRPAPRPRFNPPTPTTSTSQAPAPTSTPIAPLPPLPTATPTPKPATPDCIRSWSDTSGTRLRFVDPNGVPQGHARPENTSESDGQQLETRVDTLTLQLHHDTADIHVPLPGGELKLTVRRTLTREAFSAKSHFKPNVAPDRPFGVCWTSGLTPNVRFETNRRKITVDSARCGLTPDSVVVTDENGTSHRFATVYRLSQEGPATEIAFLPFPSNSTQADVLQNRLSAVFAWDAEAKRPVFQRLVFRRKFGTTLTFVGRQGRAAVTLHKDLPDGESVRREYYRLAGIKDRFGTRVVYDYLEANASLIPDAIRAPTRAGLTRTLTLRHDGQRVHQVSDPRGGTYRYAYKSDVVRGGARLTYLTRVVRPEQSQTDYTYDFGGASFNVPFQKESEKDDPKFHVDLRSIASPAHTVALPDRSGAPGSHRLQVGATRVTFEYALDGSRLDWRTAFDAEGKPKKRLEPYVSRTRPRVLKSIQHANGDRATFVFESRPVILSYPGTTPSVLGGIVRTRVTDCERRVYRYQFDRPDYADTAAFETFFADGVRRPMNVTVRWTRATLGLPLGLQQQAEFLPEAGLAVRRFVHLHGGVTEWSYEDRYDLRTLLGVTWLPAGDHPMLNGYYRDPTRKRTLLKTPGVAGQSWLETTYVYYSSNHPGVPQALRNRTGVNSSAPRAHLDLRSRVMSGQLDPEGRLSVFTLDARTGLRTSAVVKSGVGGQTLQHTVWERKSFPFPGFVTRTVAKGDSREFPDRVTESTPDRMGYPATMVVRVDGGDDVRSQRTYDANGNVTATTDPRGYTTRYRFDALDRVTRTEHPDGGVVTTGYDRRGGDPVWTRDEVGRVTINEHDSKGRQIRTWRVMGSTPEASPAAADLVSLTAYNGIDLPVRRVDPRGTVTETQLDALYRPTRVIRAAGTSSALTVRREYTAQSGLKPARVIDPRGFVTETIYDSLLRAVVVRAQIQKTPARYAESRTVFDRVGNRILVTGPLGHQSVNVFDGLERVVATYSLGPNLRVAPTARLHQRLLLSRSEHWVRTRYSLSGLKSGTEELVALDLLRRTYRSRHTAYRYDTAGRMRVQIQGNPMTGLVDAGSLRTETDYDLAGNVVSVKDALGSVWRTRYDARNRATHRIAPRVRDAARQVEIQPTTVTRYDRAGQVVQATDPRGSVTRFRYDRAGRRTATLLPRVDRVATGPQGGGLAIVRTHYDAGGNVTKVSDPEGFVTLNAYDPHGRLIATKTNPVVPASGPGVLAAASLTHVADVIVRKAYDGQGNLTSLTDGRLRVTRFRYDGLGRLLERSHDSSGDRVQFTYDAVHMTARTDADRNVTRYTHDSLGRVRTVRYYPSGAGLPGQHDRAFEHDALGNLLSVRLLQGLRTPTPEDRLLQEVRLVYDFLGRVLEETSAGATHHFSYDAVGNLRRAAVSSSNTAERFAFVLNSTFDSHHRLILLQDVKPGAGQHLTAYAYDAAGNLVSKTHDNGTRELCEVDAQGRKTLIRTLRGGLELQAFRMRYDWNGNLRRSSDTFARPEVASRTMDLRYDGLGRLLVERVSGAETRYAYDKVNNRVLKQTPSGREVSEVNAKNQVTRLTRSGAGGALSQVVSFDYDLRGNRTARRVVDAQGTRLSVDRYTYDLENRLVGVQQVSGKRPGTYRYVYDHRTRRTAVFGPGNARRRVVHLGGTSVVESVGAFGADRPDVEYVRSSGLGGGIGSVLYSRRGLQQRQTYHYNARGDVTTQTDARGGIVYQGAYEAFGRRLAEYQSTAAGVTPDRQRANTREEDPTGFLKEGHRYRDLETGTYITRDPAGLVDGPNLYTYVRQSPWTKVDPDGLKEKKVTLDDVKEKGSISLKDAINNLTLTDAESESIMTSVGMTPMTPKKFMDETGFEPNSFWNSWNTLTKTGKLRRQYKGKTDYEIAVKESSRLNKAVATKQVFIAWGAAGDKKRLRILHALADLASVSTMALPGPRGVGGGGAASGSANARQALLRAEAKAADDKLAQVSGREAAEAAQGVLSNSKRFSGEQQEFLKMANALDTASKKVGDEISQAQASALHSFGNYANKGRSNQIKNLDHRFSAGTGGNVRPGHWKGDRLRPSADGHMNVHTSMHIPVSAN